MPAVLSVNLNAVAVLRNRRDLPWPDIENIGRLALDAGAGGLTVHPRPDQRHTRNSDLPILRALIDDEFPKAEFNIEGYPTREFIDLALANEPEQITLVPDDPAQATSDHGWDIHDAEEMLIPIVKELKASGARVVLFCDPDTDKSALQKIADMGVARIELYTEPYAACWDNDKDAERQAIILGETAKNAIALGVGINAGHDLTVANLPRLVKAVPDLAEVSIGHGLTADALEFGMRETVKRFIAALQ